MASLEAGRGVGRPGRALALTVTATTTAGPETLFALLDDLPAITRAEPRLKETGWEPPGMGVRPGARARLETNVGWLVTLRPLIGPARATVRVEAASRPHHLRLAVQAPVARGHAIVTVEPRGDAHHVVTVTVDARLTGVARLRPLRRAAQRYARPSLNRVLHSVLAQAERAVYSPDPAAGSPGIRTTNTTPP